MMLEQEVGVLSEENALLRDFTYNVDPMAKKKHEECFATGKENVRKSNKWDVNEIWEREDWPFEGNKKES